MLGGIALSLDCLAWRELADARATLLHRGTGDETKRAIVDVLAEVEAIAEQVTLERVQAIAHELVASMPYATEVAALAGPRGHKPSLAEVYCVALATDKREELLGWVRREMAREVERRRKLRVLARQQTARDVARVSWPDKRDEADRYDVRSDANHDALTLRIASVLGIDEGVARALCEAAGWPT